MIDGEPIESFIWFYTKIEPSTHRIHGAAIYGNMDPINIPPMLTYIPYMYPMGWRTTLFLIHRFPQGLVHHPRECFLAPQRHISFSQRTFRRRTWSSSGNIKMDPHPNFQTFWSPLVVFRDIISHDMGLEAANGCGFFFHQPWGIQHFETKTSNVYWV